MTMMRNSPFRTFVVVLEEPRRLQVMIESDLSPDCNCHYQPFLNCHNTHLKSFSIVIIPLLKLYLNINCHFLPFT